MRGDELELRGGSPGSGEKVSVVEGARGGVYWPESSSERRRTEDGAESNWVAWGRARVRRLGEMERGRGRLSVRDHSE